jgi:hypothetical protein
MRIIGVGLSKTGTTSLTKACEILGFRALHDRELARRSIKENAYNNIGLLDGELLPYEALFDGPYIKYVKPLVAQYPDAKFILHVRQIDTWLESRIKQSRRTGLQPNHGRWRRRHETLVPDARAAIQQVAHLEIDVCAGDGWEKLCPFLGVPVPSVAFPHENASNPNE